MIDITTILIIIFVHWVADFIMQDERWALGKSKNWFDLLSHTVTYSLIWVFPMYWLFSFTKPPAYAILATLGFVYVTFVCHTLTDYVTSRIVRKKFAAKEYGSPIPNFGGFTVIGFDQVLHYIQLFTTYYLLK